MPDRPNFILNPGTLSLSEIHDHWRKPLDLTLSAAAAGPIADSAATVAAVVKEGRRVYGVNTGFGILARQHISDDQLSELQRRLVLSHSAGVGPTINPSVTRLILLLKINSLARGHSGIRPEVIERLMVFHNADALPVVPSQGSVGASGDLAPLAHLAAPLIGEGELCLDGEVLPTESALQRLGLAPIELHAKEGLALLNGTQVSTALALAGLFSGLEVFAAALTAGALSVDAALGSDVPFDARIQQLRGHPGQIHVAARLRDLLAGSGIRASHLDCDRVQDPYSLRCQPQVMGAVLDLLDSAARVLQREANAVSDNPLVFAEQNEILSGGNFHAEPVAFAADMIALGLAEIGALAERRIALLTDANMSALPAFLVAEPGLNSGFMIAHVTAAALASENKILSHPASVDSLPTSANQEDHVSMATHGARRLADMAANSGRIAAIELMAAAQGIDLRQPLQTSPKLSGAVARLREEVAYLGQDRAFAPDIERAYRLVDSGWFLDFLWPQPEDCPVLQTTI